MREIATFFAHNLVRLGGIIVEERDRSRPEPFSSYPPPFSEAVAAEPPAVPEMVPAPEPARIAELEIGEMPEEPADIVMEGERTTVTPVSLEPPANVEEAVRPPDAPQVLQNTPPVLDVPGLSAATRARIQVLIGKGVSLPAISALREQTGMGFLDAARTITSVEDVMNANKGWNPIDSIPLTLADETTPLEVVASEIEAASALLDGFNLPQDVFANIYSLTKNNVPIQAIAELRQHTGLGFRDAKNVIDQLSGLVGARQAQCYIATACYGDADHPDVVALRRFRDERLLPPLWGRAFVRAYYALSPGLAHRMRRHTLATGLVRRWVLEPVVRRLRKQR